MAVDALRLIGVVLACYAVLALIVAPIRLGKRWWIAANPHFEALGFSDQRVPAGARQFFEQVVKKITPNGFRYVSCIIHADQAPRTIAYLAVFSNDATRDVACAMAVVTHLTTGVVHEVRIVEYVSEYVDGTSLSTGNMDLQGLAPNPAWKDAAHFPGMSDLRQLYRIHQARTARYEPIAKRIIADHEHAAELHRDMKRTHEDQAEMGYFVLDPSGTRYRLTIKGMFLGMWKHVWPMKVMIRTVRHWKARRILRDLDMPTDYATAGGCG
jgi:hypothetical protein